MSWQGESLQLPNGMKACQFIHNTIGLKVIIVEMHTAPLHGYMRVVNAGSAMENGVVGKGIAHFIEHMSFRIDDGKYWKFEREGHEDNAMTTEDATSFYDFGNSEHIHDVIGIDGHRFLTPEVPAAGIPIEMFAVLNEKARGEEPCGTLFRTAQASAHMYSNYHCPTIGLEEDIRSVTAADMQKFRETYYKVSNATFIVVGHVNEKEVLDTFEKTYKNVPYEEFKPKERPKEPLQIGKRTIEINMVSPCAMMCLTWVSPPANTKDSIALSVLSRIISNGNSGRKLSVLNNSPIHNLGCYAPRNVDAYIWCIHGAVVSNDKVQDAESRVTKMLGLISRNLTENEVKDAVAALKVEWGEEPFTNIHTTLMALGEACALGDWKDISKRYHQVSEITVDDVKNVIKTYLNEHQLTSTFLKTIPETIRLSPPSPMKSVPTIPATPSKEVKECSFYVKEGQVSSSSNKKMRMQVLKSSSRNLRISISIPLDHDQRWHSKVFSSLFGKGCEHMNVRYGPDKLASRCVELGIDYECFHDDHGLNLNFTCSKKSEYDRAIHFITEGMIKNTTFDRSYVDMVVKNMSAETGSLRTSDKYQAKKMLVTAMFDSTEYGEPIHIKCANIRAVNRHDIKAFYKEKVMKPMGWCCTVCVPKDLPMTSKHVEGICQLLVSTGKAATKTIPEWKPRREKWVSRPKKSSFATQVMEGYGSTTVMMGQVTTLKNYDRKAIALSIAVQSLGGGMTSTLMNVLRGQDGDKNGVYGVYAQQEDCQKAHSFVVIDATFTPGLAQHGIHEMQDLVKQWTKFESGKDKPWENPEKKLAIAKNQLIGARTLETDDFSSVTEVFHRHLKNGKKGEKEWNNYLTTLNSITLDEVKDALKELDASKWVTVCITPEKLEDSFQDSDVEE